jgi:hypothetical protein
VWHDCFAEVTSVLVELDAAELEVVADVLRRAMADLREEIYKTETAEFKDELKKSESVLSGVMHKIAAAQGG